MRRSGVLLHPSSLPGPHGSGDLGEHARYFIDWLVSAQQQLWQMLPIGGIGSGNSPYMSDSAFAGNPLLLDLQDFVTHGWLHQSDLDPGEPFDRFRVDFAKVAPWRLTRLEQASKSFLSNQAQHPRLTNDFTAFRTQHANWLEDYALFKAIEERYPGVVWHEWPQALALREPAALSAARLSLQRRIDHFCFLQWRFVTQWRALREYAAEHGIKLLGDTPIFVALHSADVWAHRDLFQLDAAGRPNAVAGVPPDYFSALGQLWGNPLYRWEQHAADGYAWWISRMRHALNQFDYVRIDHFRGFAAYWRVPNEAVDARTGAWCPGPGKALFDALRTELGSLPLIAEDLGIITADVIALRQELELPGMVVLQFAWDGDPANKYLPHHHQRFSVVYTGTHDNDTTRGWWQSLDERTRQQIRGYFGNDGENGDILVRAALASVCDTAILPMQDVLGLATGHRMNTPGSAHGCWEWRFDWSQVGPEPARRLADACRRYGRSSDTPHN